MRTLQCTVPAAFDGRPLKHLLRGELGISSTLLKTLKWREGAILLNGAGVHVNAVVRTGDTVTVVLSERAPRETDVAPLDIPLAIVYEDEDLLVLNKPAGLAMHPMSTDLAAPNLAGALVAYLGEGSLVKRCVAPDGLPSRTEYEVLSYHGELTLLRLAPRTGRTHQLRVHMASLGHPLAGDWLYGTEDRALIARPALHSYALWFTHPLTHAVLHFTAPLPEDMERLIK